MKRYPFPASSLTGAWRDGCDEARTHACAAMDARLRLAQGMRAFLKLHAADLLSLVKGYGDREASTAISAVVVSMTRSMDWSDKLGTQVNRADSVLSSLATRPSTSPTAAEALEIHRKRLAQMRRCAADIIHLEFQARIAAGRARTPGRSGRADN